MSHRQPFRACQLCMKINNSHWLHTGFKFTAKNMGQLMLPNILKKVFTLSQDSKFCFTKITTVWHSRLLHAITQTLKAAEGSHLWIREWKEGLGGVLWACNLLPPVAWHLFGYTEPDDCNNMIDSLCGAVSHLLVCAAFTPSYVLY